MLQVLQFRVEENHDLEVQILLIVGQRNEYAPPLDVIHRGRIPKVIVLGQNILFWLKLAN